MEEHQNKPLLETQISISKDGKYIIHKTVIVDIKPITYYKKVMEKEGVVLKPFYMGLVS